MTLGLTFLYPLNRKYFDLKKSPFKCYGFSVAVNVFLRLNVNGYRQKLKYKHYISINCIFVFANLNSCKAGKKSNNIIKRVTL